MGNPSEQKVESARFRTLSTQVWRRGWDSNPCGIAPKLISSQPRYDHFDTSPCLSSHLTPEKHLGFWGELMGRTYLIFGFRSLRKPSKIKGSGVRRVHKGDTISSQPRIIRTVLSQNCKKTKAYFIIVLFSQLLTFPSTGTPRTCRLLLV